MNRLRIFIAIELPEKVRRHVASAIQKLSLQNQPVTWADPEGSHITLHFLGNIGQARMEAASLVVGEVVAKFSVFELSTGGISYFYKDPNTGNSAVFLDVVDVDKRLRDLYYALRDSLEEEGFNPPKRIQPHITLGRLKRQRKRHVSKNILAELSETEVKFVPFKVSGVNVYESVGVSKEKTRYHLLKRFEFEK